jgi:hypothetical protein
MCKDWLGRRGEAFGVGEARIRLWGIDALMQTGMIAVRFGGFPR